MRDDAADVHGGGICKGLHHCQQHLLPLQRVVIQLMMIISASHSSLQSFTLTAAVKMLSGVCHAALLHPCLCYASADICIHPSFSKRQRNADVVS